mgnify:CR=1 FL=1
MDVPPTRRPPPAPLPACPPVRTPPPATFPPRPLPHAPLSSTARSPHSHVGHLVRAAVAPGPNSGDDAAAIRRRILLAVEAAERSPDRAAHHRLLTFVIVGGGPVGLYLAALLLQEGVAVRVLEQRLHRESHSRAIGIHPPALAALDRASVASAMVDAGVQILGGIAVSGGKTVGSMSFASVSERFPFVLSLPQVTTEYLLERRVDELDDTALGPGARGTAKAGQWWRNRARGKVNVQARGSGLSLTMFCSASSVRTWQR